jgi:hypothetical protein
VVVCLPEDVADVDEDEETEETSETEVPIMGTRDVSRVIVRPETH